jgi:intracellular multiplication protein IcmP
MSYPTNAPAKDPIEGLVVAILVLLVGLPLLVWFLFHAEISAAFIAVRKAQAALLFFDPEGQAMLRDWIARANPETTTLKGLWESGETAGYYARWVSVIAILSMGGYFFRKHPDVTSRFREKHSIRSLAERGLDQWPEIGPALALDIPSYSIDHPVYGMRMRPRDFGKKHGILVDASALTDRMREGELVAVDGGARYVRIDRLKQIYTWQVGAEWPGIEALPIHERHLLVAFATQIADPDPKNATAQLIIKELARSARQAFLKGDPSLIRSKRAASIEAKTMASAKVQAVIQRHRWTRTILMAMLEEARINGVLAPNWFNWLKAVDRVLWYALNDLGLYVASVEAAGTRAQYNAERAAGRALPSLLLEPAVTGFIEYLDTILPGEDDWAPGKPR